jgi:hypothetical protein
MRLMSVGRVSRIVGRATGSRAAGRAAGSMRRACGVIVS